MENTLTAAELKRRGVAAIEDRLTYGPVHIVKRNKPAAVVISEAEYRRLSGQQPDSVPGLSAVQWLLSQSARGTRTREDIDAALSAERDW
ncbi:MAG: type II toxin-antitoxin system prevent-host-death family antitoxin [Wenzhouxiangella sp.]|jgi:PHD/YefM family antitoxin component YafN of YafNO toxin-antitoxin module|nr:type II toxin-antitoxin system prevent-host-death family antitoxin [Wenzhouxiangella sp.]